MRRARSLTFALVVMVAMVLAAGVLALVGTTKPAEAAFPGANSKIAFVSQRVTTNNPTGDSEIFAMNPDRTGIEQLTFNTTFDSWPAWSADGGWMVWDSHQDGNGFNEIYMRSYCGGIDPCFFETRRLTNNSLPDGRPTFNHDTSKIAFFGTRFSTTWNFEILVMDTNATTNDETNLTNNPAEDREPAFSPNGEKIAFASNRTTGTGVNNPEGDFEIFTMNPDGTGLTQLTFNTAVDTSPVWSADGTKIAFASRRDGNSNIYVMNATDGSAQTRLTKKAADDSSPAWSPDGTKIAFTSSRGGDAEIFVMKASRPESKRNRPKNLTQNNVGDYSPDWRPIPQP